MEGGHGYWAVSFVGDEAVVEVNHERSRRMMLYIMMIGRHRARYWEGVLKR